jgi:hypothetical protein
MILGLLECANWSSGSFPPIDSVGRGLDLRFGQTPAVERCHERVAAAVGEPRPVARHVVAERDGDGHPRQVLAQPVGSLPGQSRRDDLIEVLAAKVLPIAFNRPSSPTSPSATAPASCNRCSSTSSCCWATDSPELPCRSSFATAPYLMVKKEGCVAGTRTQNSDGRARLILGRPGQARRRRGFGLPRPDIDARSPLLTGRWSLAAKVIGGGAVGGHLQFSNVDQLAVLISPESFKARVRRR